MTLPCDALGPPTSSDGGLVAQRGQQLCSEKSATPQISSELGFLAAALGKEPHGPRGGGGGEEGSARPLGQLGPSPHTSLRIYFSQK